MWQSCRHTQVPCKRVVAHIILLLSPKETKTFSACVDGWMYQRSCSCPRWCRRGYGVICGKEYKLCSSILYSFLHPRVTPSLFGSNILLSTLSRTKYSKHYLSSAQPESCNEAFTLRSPSVCVTADMSLGFKMFGLTTNLMETVLQVKEPRENCNSAAIYSVIRKLQLKGRMEQEV
jgi:hypothetical protein